MIFVYYSFAAGSQGSTAQRNITARGGGRGSRPKKMYGKRLGDGVEYHLMSPTPRRKWYLTTGRRFH